MIKVKFLSRSRLPDGNIGDSFLRRFPGREPVFGGCQFIFDPTCRDYDWLAVYDDLPRDNPVEALACSPNNTLLLTGEPPSITRYGTRYLAQFGHVLSSQEPGLIKHRNLITSQSGLFWYYGGSDDRGTWDSLANATPPAKELSLSCVCSTKAMRHTMHHKRLKFVKHLMNEALPEIHVWGYGMRELKNKADAIDPYKYHLAIENHSCDHHWTEKLADAFLGFSLPIYFGCTNLDHYFPKESYVWIDLCKPDEAISRIRRTLEEDPYESRLPAIIEARRRVLEEYATFPQLARLIVELNKPTSGQAKKMLLGRRLFRRKKPLYTLLDLVESYIK